MAKAEDDGFRQEPHESSGASENALEVAIGRQVRRYRREQNLTITELARVAQLSTGMLSKIENGQTSPSLSTLRSVAGALNVPVTALFREYEEERDAVFVKAGKGLMIERRGTRAGHQYQLLGHSPGGAVVVEPYLITLSEKSDVFPLFQHDGKELIYVLEGSVAYRHADRVYELEPGDSLFFEADAPHGPEELRRLPIRFLSFICYARDS